MQKDHELPKASLSSLECKESFDWNVKQFSLWGKGEEIQLIL